MEHGLAKKLIITCKLLLEWMMRKWQNSTILPKMEVLEMNFTKCCTQWLTNMIAQLKTLLKLIALLKSLLLINGGLLTLLTPTQFTLLVMMLLSFLRLTPSMTGVVNLMLKVLLNPQNLVPTLKLPITSPGIETCLLLRSLPSPLLDTLTMEWTMLTTLLEFGTFTLTKNNKALPLVATLTGGVLAKNLDSKTTI